MKKKRGGEPEYDTDGRRAKNAGDRDATQIYETV